MAHSKKAFLAVDPSNRFQKIDTCISAKNNVVSFKCYDRLEGREVIWHEVSSLNSEQLKKLIEGAQNSMKIRSPNILKFVHFWDSPETKKFMYITESASNQSISHHLECDVDQLRSAVAARWFRGVLLGLDFLHSLPTPIIHSRLDLNSIFFKPNTKIIKLRSPIVSPIMFQTSKIHIHLRIWTPPESLFNYECTASDIWEFGIAMLTAVTKTEPYGECESAYQLALKLSKFEPPQILNTVSDPLMKEVISLCFKPTNERPSARFLLTHPFFNQEFKNQRPTNVGEQFELLFFEN